MTAMQNFVAVDWRSGADRIYFFFREKNTYSRFDLGDNKAPSDYPKYVNDNWNGFDKSAADLCFGFTSANASWNGGIETLWLFYREGNTPFVCEFSQDTDKAVTSTPVAQSRWDVLVPHFDKVVGVMWSESSAFKESFWILLNDGNYLIYDLYSKILEIHPLKNSPWAELEQYKGQMMTAALNDYPTFDTYFYIFLNDSRYLRYEQQAKKVVGPYTISDSSWPGLLKG